MTQEQFIAGLFLEGIAIISVAVLFLRARVNREETITQRMRDDSRAELSERQALSKTLETSMTSMHEMLSQHTATTERLLTVIAASTEAERQTVVRLDAMVPTHQTQIDASTIDLKAHGEQQHTTTRASIVNEIRELRTVLETGFNDIRVAVGRAAGIGDVQRVTDEIKALRETVDRRVHDALHVQKVTEP